MCSAQGVGGGRRRARLKWEQECLRQPWVSQSSERWAREEQTLVLTGVGSWAGSPHLSPPASHVLQQRLLPCPDSVQGSHHHFPYCK